MLFLASLVRRAWGKSETEPRETTGIEHSSLGPSCATHSLLVLKTPLLGEGPGSLHRQPGRGGNSLWWTAAATEQGL